MRSLLVLALALLLCVDTYAARAVLPPLALVLSVLAIAVLVVVGAVLADDALGGEG